MPVKATDVVVAVANHWSVEPGVPSAERTTEPVPHTEPGVVDTTDGIGLMNTSTGISADVHPVVRFLDLT